VGDLGFGLLDRRRLDERASVAGEQLAAKARLDRASRDDDEVDAVTEQLAKREEARVGRLGDGDDNAALVVLLNRQSLEPGSVLPRHAPERLAVERDRRPLEVPEMPLLCEHLGQ